MAIELKIFQSLNCSICEFPYLKADKGPRSPRQLRCGRGVCSDCWMKDYSMKRDERKHRCDLADYCFDLSHNPALFLIEILNSSSIALTKNGKGYVLLEPLHPVPECSMCHLAYEIDAEPRRPFPLICRHSICVECFLKTKDGFQNGEVYLGCPICRDQRYYPPEVKRNLFQAFLEELSEMIEQIKIVEKPQFKENLDCENCDRLYDIADMFYCSNCEKKICGICAFRSHRQHDVSDVSLQEVKEMVSSLHEQIGQKIINRQSSFKWSHQEINSKFDKVINASQQRVNELGNLKYHEAKSEQVACKALIDKFDQISEEYMPHLNTLATKLKDLITEIYSR